MRERSPYPLVMLDHWYTEARNGLLRMQTYLAESTSDQPDVEDTRRMYSEDITTCLDILCATLPTRVALQLNDERARLAADIAQQKTWRRSTAVVAAE